MKPLADEDGAGEELARVDAGACIEAPVALGKRRQIGYDQERTEVLQEGSGGAEMPSAIAPAPRPYLGWSGVRVRGPGADEGCSLIRGDPDVGMATGQSGVVRTWGTALNSWFCAGARPALPRRRGLHGSRCARGAK